MAVFRTFSPFVMRFLSVSNATAPTSGYGAKYGASYGR